MAAPFLTALAANADWLHVTTLGETIDNVPPLGKVYVPEGSYREMDRWSTLAGRGLKRVAGIGFGLAPRLVRSVFLRGLRMLPRLGWQRLTRRKLL